MDQGAMYRQMDQLHGQMDRWAEHRYVDQRGVYHQKDQEGPHHQIGRGRMYRRMDPGRVKGTARDTYQLSGPSGNGS